jgi:hypothetical protein
MELDCLVHMWVIHLECTDIVLPMSLLRMFDKRPLLLTLRSKVLTSYSLLMITHLYCLIHMMNIVMNILRYHTIHITQLSCDSILQSITLSIHLLIPYRRYIRYLLTSLMTLLLLLDIHHQMLYFHMMSLSMILMLYLSRPTSLHLAYLMVSMTVSMALMLERMHIEWTMIPLQMYHRSLMMTYRDSKVIMYYLRHMTLLLSFLIHKN